MTERAVVPWSKLKFDIFLMALPFLVIILSVAIDIYRGHHEFFQRGGAVVVLISAILAYRGLDKYWNKADQSFKRGYWKLVSKNQRKVDLCALAWSIIGTAIWGYGDILYCWCIPGNT